MGRPGRPDPEKLVLAVMYPPDLENDLPGILAGAFGDLDFSGESYEFGFTDYYAPEFGSGLRKTLFSVRALAEPDRLAELKGKGNVLEGRWTGADGRRRINVDPGLLNLARFTLATTKDHAHRIYLRDGIFAELTLLFSRGGWRDLPWTYPDYRTTLVQAMLSRIRDLYRVQLNGLMRPGEN